MIGQSQRIKHGGADENFCRTWLNLLKAKMHSLRSENISITYRWLACQGLLLHKSLGHAHALSEGGNQGGYGHGLRNQFCKKVQEHPSSSRT